MTSRLLFSNLIGGFHPSLKGLLA